MYVGNYNNYLKGLFDDLVNRSTLIIEGLTKVDVFSKKYDALNNEFENIILEANQIYKILKA